MKILISAAETSSDAHGAELLHALQEQARAEGSEGIEAFGVGGPKLQAAGLKAVVDARELLAMGFFEVLGRLPRVLSALKEVAEAAREERPDVAVVIDYPDFHFRLARRLKALGVPVIYYIPPKVWVWRKKRMRVLRDSFVKVLSILPFEVPFYEKERVPVTYVGNPLVDELPLDLDREQARAKLGLDAQAKVLTLMPGSRPSELRMHLEVMLDAAQRAAAFLRSRQALGPEEKLVVLMPLPVTASFDALRERVAGWLKQASGGIDGLGFILDVRVSQGDAAECLVASDAGLIKSGTSTLEAAMLGCPHAVVYKTNKVTEWIFKYLIRYKGPVGLSNLVAGWSPDQPYLVNEIVLSDVTVENLCEETLTLMQDSARRARLTEGFARLRALIIGATVGGRPESPSARAAREVLGVIREGKRVP